MALSLSWQLHIVHYNSADYSSFEEAKDKPNGLAVLAFLYVVGLTPGKLSNDSPWSPFIPRWEGPAACSRAACLAYKILRLSSATGGRAAQQPFNSMLCLGRTPGEYLLQ